MHLEDAAKAYDWLGERYPNLSQQARYARARNMAGAAAAKSYNDLRAKHPNWNESRLVSAANSYRPDYKVPKGFRQAMQSTPESALEMSYHVNDVKLPGESGKSQAGGFHPVDSVRNFVGQATTSLSSAKRFNDLVNSVPPEQREAFFKQLERVVAIIQRMPKDSMSNLVGTLEKGVDAWNRFSKYRADNPWVDNVAGFVTKHPWWSAGIGLAGVAGTAAALQGAVHGFGNMLAGRGGSSLATYGTRRW